MATATVELLDGRPAILLDGSKVGDKLLLVTYLPDGYAAGQAVEYTRIWEGEGVRVGNRDLRVDLVYGGQAKGVSGIAGDLGVDEDQLGFQNL